MRWCYCSANNIKNKTSLYFIHYCVKVYIYIPFSLCVCTPYSHPHNPRNPHKQDTAVFASVRKNTTTYTTMACYSHWRPSHTELSRLCLEKANVLSLYVYYTYWFSLAALLTYLKSKSSHWNPTAAKDVRLWLWEIRTHDMCVCVRPPRRVVKSTTYGTYILTVLYSTHRVCTARTYSVCFP